MHPNADSLAEPAGAGVSADVTVQIEARKLQLRLTVPAGPTRLVELLPLAHKIATAVVGAAVEDALADGETISCKKGCGACCRQLVPISQVEARRIRDLVVEMP